MDAVAYLKEKERMTNRCCIRCDTCPFGDKDFDGGCGDFEMTCPEQAVRIVEEWSKAHPIQTNADKFKEVFGHDIWCNKNFDKDRRAFVICGDKVGRVQQSEWLDAPYEAPKGYNNG